MRFQNPENLYFLFAIAIPILIHLLNLRKHQTIYFSSIRFLKNIKENHHQKSKLKNILILLSRILAISFLILAFSQPYIPLENYTQPDNISIYIDNSLSMDIDYGEGNLLNNAKEKAKEITKLYPYEQSFYLITNDFLSKHNKSYSKDALINQIDKIEATSNQKSIKDIISRMRIMNSNNHLYFISDMQKNTIKIDEIINNKGENKISLIPVKNKAISNISIDSCFTSSPIFISENEINLKVLISNNGPEDIIDQVIFLYLDNQQKSQQYINILSGERKEITFNFLTQDNNIINGEIRVNDSPISYDNRLFFTLNKSNKIKVCIINQDKENKALNYLLEKDTILFDYTSFNTSNINYNILSQQDFIILNTIQSINSGLMTSLNKFISTGRSLLIIPPSELENLSEYNSQLKKLKINTIHKTSYYPLKINKFNFEHPIYHNVFSKKIDLIDYPVSYRNYQLNNTIINTKIINLEDNNPFLISYKINESIIYQFASPLDSLFNNFTQHALFVPTLINMGTLSIHMDAPYYIVQSNKKINYNKKKIYEGTPRIIGPNIEIIPTIKNINGEYTIDTHNQINKHGIYSLKYNENILNSLAFNYNRSENNIEALSSNDLKEIKKTNNNIDVLSSNNKTLISKIKEQKNGKELWKIAIILSLIFFAIEILLIKIMKL